MDFSTVNPFILHNYLTKKCKSKPEPLKLTNVGVYFFISFIKFLSFNFLIYRYSYSYSSATYKI